MIHFFYAVIDYVTTIKSVPLTQTEISKALEGDGLALRLCMERIALAHKDKSVSLAEMTDAMDASKAASSVLTAVWAEGTFVIQCLRSIFDLRIYFKKGQTFLVYIELPLK